jgi:hypothetical protein
MEKKNTVIFYGPTDAAHGKQVDEQEYNCKKYGIVPPSGAGISHSLWQQGMG